MGKKSPLVESMYEKHGVEYPTTKRKIIHKVSQRVERRRIEKEREREIYNKAYMKARDNQIKKRARRAAKGRKSKWELF